MYVIVKVLVYNNLYIIHTLLRKDSAKLRLVKFAAASGDSS